MGGNAFGSILPSSAFPRLPPLVYRALQKRIGPLLEELYMYVGIPRVAPEKLDHGDLDLIVYLPRRHTIPTQSSVVLEISDSEQELSIYVPHEVVAATIKAKHLNPMDGNRISNYAVPISEGEWAVHGLTAAKAEDEARKDAGEEGIFYQVRHPVARILNLSQEIQVDVNVCVSKAEWDRRLLFNSYGDLGMIMGLIAKNVGLHLSSKGLKVNSIFTRFCDTSYLHGTIQYPDPPNPPLILSESFHDIFAFFGWSMDEWESGFETTLASYRWAINSRFMEFSHFKLKGAGFKKKEVDRKMYIRFIEWASSQDIVRSHCEIPDAREAALDFFNKRSELKQRRIPQQAKSVFSGTNVRDWTDLGGYWLGVKKIMDGVRERLGGDELISKFVAEEGEEKLRSIVLEVQFELGVWPKSKMGWSATTNGEETNVNLEQGIEKLRV